MKLDQITAGEEYALEDERNKHLDPRRVKVLGIVEVPEQMWNRVLEKYTERKVRKVEVKYLDPPSGRNARYWPAKKGTKTTVESRRITAPWSEIGPGIKTRIEEELRAEELRKTTEKRVRALIGGRSGNWFITLRQERQANLDVWGNDLEKLLALAEKGAAV